MASRSYVRALLAALLLASCQSGALTSAPSPEHSEPGLSGAAIAGAGAGDRNEAAMLGSGVFAQPYFRGVRVVGQTQRSGWQLGWIGNCAYAANPNEGINVIDVRDPAHPRYVETLTGRGASVASENFDAREAPNGRRVVVGGIRVSDPPAGAPPSNEGPAYLDIFDASDCAHPRHVAEFTWPEGIHTVSISPDGMRVYGTHIAPFTGHGGIHVVDISDMAHPRYVGKFGATGPDGRTWEFAAHNIAISPDERRIYAGVIGSRGGDLNRGFTTPEGQYSVERLGGAAGGVYILDNSDLALGRPNPHMRLVGTAEHVGWHDVSIASINGAPHIVAAGEGAVPCPGAWPRIANIADETQPRIVGEFRLDLNRQENCPPTAAGLGLGGMSTASSHYSSVDNADDARLGLFNMAGAGLRIVDLRDPARPVEVAYFRPGGFCSGFTRYMQRTGQIWLTCGGAGFYVLELAPDVRAALRRH